MTEEDWRALADFTEVRPDGRGGTKAWWLPGIWPKIQDEIDRRQFRREDLAARAEGFRNADAALKKLKAMPAAEAGPIYLRIFAR